MLWATHPSLLGQQWSLALCQLQVLSSCLWGEKWSSCQPRRLQRVFGFLSRDYAELRDERQGQGQKVRTLHEQGLGEGRGALPRAALAR